MTAPYATALHVRGLSWQGGAGPVLFLDRKVSQSSLPAAFSTATLVYGYNAFPMVQGATHSTSILDPVGQAGTPSVRLKDDQVGTLAQIFAPDPVGLNTTRWAITNDLASQTTTLRGDMDPARTKLIFQGVTSPVANQIVWVGKEALKVSGTPALAPGAGSGAWQVTVVRAQAGSRAITHYLNTWSYPPGDDGSRETLFATSRPDFDGASFEAQLFHFKLDPNDPEAITSTDWVWNGFVAGRPTCDTQGLWTLPIGHVTRLIAEWLLGSEQSKEVELSHPIAVIEERSGEGLTYSPWEPRPPKAYARQAKAFLTRYEAERFFGQSLHLPGQSQLDYDASNPTTNDTITLEGKRTASNFLTYQALLTVGGYTWIYRVEQIAISVPPASIAGIDPDNLVAVTLSYVAAQPGASNKDNPVSYDQGVGFRYPSRDYGLNEGWSYYREPLRCDKGETPPKITLRPRLHMSFVDAFLTFLLSGQGGKINHGTYDLLFGHRGMELDPSWVSLGSTGADPTTIDERTTEFLKLGQILNAAYDYVLRPGLSLKAWVNNELLLHCCLLMFVESTGAIAARRWACAKPVSLTSTTLLIGQQHLVQLGERLKQLRALVLKRNIDPFTLEPRDSKPVQLPEARAKDAGEALEVISWQQGGKFTDAELGTGEFALLERAFLTTLRDAPPLYLADLFVSDVIAVVDDASVTDPTIARPTGRGVTNLPCLAMRVDRNLEQGIKRLAFLEDGVNQFLTQHGSHGHMGPALSVLQVRRQISSVRWIVDVDSLGDATFNISTSHSGFWATLASRAGRVRVVTFDAHNPALAGERQGLLEASALVASVAADPSGQNRIELIFDTSWGRGGFGLLDILKTGASILPSDFHTADTSPEGLAVGNLITPDASQLAASLDMAKVAGSVKFPSFDDRVSLFDT